MTSEDTATGEQSLYYLEIPALDREQSAAFFEYVFGWRIRRGEEDRAFDAPGGLFGRWVQGHPVAAEPGYVIYVLVDDLEAATERVAPAGGSILRAPYEEGDVQVALFSDPAGNVIGAWQHESA